MIRLKDREKMCPQCDGRIPVDSEQCPYCASDQTKGPNMPPHTKEFHHQSLQDSLTAPYNPARHPPKMEKEPVMDRKQAIPTIPNPAPQETSAEERSGHFLPILLLCLAGNLLTIGLLQLLFSEGGTLRLEWQSSYWFIYCLAAAPLAFFGMKQLSR